MKKSITLCSLLFVMAANYAQQTFQLDEKKITTNAQLTCSYTLGVSRLEYYAEITKDSLFYYEAVFNVDANFYIQLDKYAIARVDINFNDPLSRFADEVVAANPEKTIANRYVAAKRSGKLHRWTYQPGSTEYGLDVGFHLRSNDMEQCKAIWDRLKS